MSANLAAQVRAGPRLAHIQHGQDSQCLLGRSSIVIHNAHSSAFTSKQALVWPHACMIQEAIASCVSSRSEQGLQALLTPAAMHVLGIASWLRTAHCQVVNSHRIHLGCFIIAVAAAESVISIYTAELLPTSCRSSVMGVCSQASRLGSVTAPFLLMAGAQLGSVGGYSQASESTSSV